MRWSLAGVAWLGASTAIADQITFDTETLSPLLKLTQSYAVSPATNHRGFSLAYRRPFPIPFLPPAQLYDLTNVALKSTRTKLWRPRAKGGSPEYTQARTATLRDKRSLPHPLDYTPMQWDEIEVTAPDVTDMQTLNGLAKLCSNAYIEAPDKKNGTKDWYDLGDKWTLDSSFGWTEDGIRGHVFATADNSTVIIAIKGTSAGGFVGGGGPTQVNDKTNDNLLFSCCCARVDWTWTPVCDCYKGGWKCEEDCVEDALVEKSVYYPLATDLYNNITLQYPNANIWLTGHSLGGSIAALLALTFGLPCVTFEAPGDLTSAKRLHLPMPPGREMDTTFGAITHVYHTADPIPQGACTGSLSLCALAGFALETRCHSGQTILFDSVNDLGWSVDVRTHGIVGIIDHLLKEDWDGSNKSRSQQIESTAKWHLGWRRRKGGSSDKDEGNQRQNRSMSNVPLARMEEDCVDCVRWEYGHFK